MQREKTMMALRPLLNCEACDCVRASCGRSAAPSVDCLVAPSWGVERSWSEEVDEVGE